MSYFQIRWKQLYLKVPCNTNTLALCKTVRNSTLFQNISNSISVCQHGLLDIRSSASNLAVLSQFNSKEIDEHERFDVLYLDFEKAFDKLDQRIMLKILKNLTSVINYSNYSTHIYIQGSNLSHTMDTCYSNILHLPEYLKDLTNFLYFSCYLSTKYVVILKVENCFSLMTSKFIDQWKHLMTH